MTRKLRNFYLVREFYEGVALMYFPLPSPARKWAWSPAARVLGPCWGACMHAVVAIASERQRENAGRASTAAPGQQASPPVSAQPSVSTLVANSHTQQSQPPSHGLCLLLPAQFTNQWILAASGLVYRFTNVIQEGQLIHVRSPSVAELLGTSLRSNWCLVRTRRPLHGPLLLTHKGILDFVLCLLPDHNSCFLQLGPWGLVEGADRPWLVFLDVFIDPDMWFLMDL